jgi:quercetin dioxygenase-like cupin family protein
LTITVKRWDRPDETVGFPKGRFDKITIGEMVLGRARYEPGWIWSKDVGPQTGQTSCPVEHVGLVISGRAAIRMDDGQEVIVGPGDFFSVGPGHDSWVVGDEPYESLHLLGASGYAKTAGSK